MECSAIRASADSSRGTDRAALDRKSTRLNSSHLVISYAGFCLEKKADGGRHQPVHGLSQFAQRQGVCEGEVGPLGESVHSCIVVFFSRNGRPRGFTFFPYPTLSG